MFGFIEQGGNVPKQEGDKPKASIWSSLSGFLKAKGEKLKQKKCESCGWEGQLEGNECPKCGSTQLKTVMSSSGKILTFLVYFAGIEILFFTILAPIKNLISAIISWLFGSAYANFFIPIGFFAFGLFFAWMIYRMGLLKGGILFVLIVLALTVGPNLLKLIPPPGGEVGKFIDMFGCLLKQADPTRCVAFASKEEVPEAEKMGGYQAIEIKFGSKYTPVPFTPPALYANDTYGYSLSVTVINPNPKDSKLGIDGFHIKSTYDESSDNKDVDMIAGGYKIMCGKADSCSSSTESCNLLPGRDLQMVIDFKHSKNGEDVECESASDFKTRLSDDECRPKCNGKKCSENITCANSICREECEHEFKYTGFSKTEFNAAEKKCVCERNKNNFTDLCYSDVFGNEVKIMFDAVYNFTVEGYGEFRVAQTEDFLQFKPKITTSAGPLSVTVYFVPDSVLKEKKREIKMIISVKNDGKGRADINEIDIKQGQAPVSFTKDDITECVDQAKNRIRFVNSGEFIEATCSLDLDQTSLEQFTGHFATIPMTAIVNYTYIQREFTVLPVNAQFC